MAWLEASTLAWYSSPMSDQLGEAVTEVGVVLLSWCSPSWDHWGEMSTDTAGRRWEH